MTSKNKLTVVIMQNPRKWLPIICYGATFLIFLGILVKWVWGLAPGEEMGFSVFNFYLLMPCVSFLAALLLGVKNAHAKRAYPVFAGIMGFIIPSLVFGGISWISLLFSFVPSAAGLGIGILTRKLRARK